MSSLIIIVNLGNEEKEEIETFINSDVRIPSEIEDELLDGLNTLIEKNIIDEKHSNYYVFHDFLIDYGSVKKIILDKLEVNGTVSSIVNINKLKS